MDRIQEQRDRFNAMVREHHALENAELRDRIEDLATERDSYRLLAQQALHALHNVTEQRDRALRLVSTLRIPQRVERNQSERRQAAA